MTISPLWNRRAWLKSAALSSAALAAGWPLDARLGLASEPADRVRGRAEHCIFLWLGGGMCHLDTFDPKRRGNSRERVAGTDYAAIPTAVEGIQVTEHLPRVARVMDRLTLVRTVNHATVDEHGTATNFVHTGRRISETIQYPSIGSLVAHELGAADGMPPYVLIGYPNASRDPGFLGPRAAYLYLTDTSVGPAGFQRHADVSDARQAERVRLLSRLRGRVAQDPSLAPQDLVLEQSLRMAGPHFLRLFDLQSEPADLRTSYGGEFGQRCLLARRLVGAGVRFVEVSHNLNFINGTGWDTHNEGQRNQHVMIQELDHALATLVTDLERTGLLDKTLVAVGTEFGRPPEFDARGGRGHQAACFSMVLAGGGLRHGRTIGVSDELAKTIVERPVSIPDMHATILAALGVDPSKELYHDQRPVPITDGGRPLRELFG